MYDRFEFNCPWPLIENLLSSKTSITVVSIDTDVLSVICKLSPILKLWESKTVTSYVKLETSWSINELTL